MDACKLSYKKGCQENSSPSAGGREYVRDIQPLCILVMRLRPDFWIPRDFHIAMMPTPLGSLKLVQAN